MKTNSISIVGYLPKDATTKNFENNNAVHTFDLGKSITIGEGDSKDKASAYFRVKVWKKNISEDTVALLKVGALVDVKGTITVEAFKGKDGNNHAKWVIVADSVEIVPKKGKNDEGNKQE